MKLLRTALVALVLILGQNIHPQPAAAATATGYALWWEYICAGGCWSLQYDVSLRADYDSGSPVHIYSSTIIGCLKNAVNTYNTFGYAMSASRQWFIYDPYQGGDVDSDPLQDPAGIWPWLCASADWEYHSSIVYNHWPPPGDEIHSKTWLCIAGGGYGNCAGQRDTYSSQMY